MLLMVVFYLFDYLILEIEDLKMRMAAHYLQYMIFQTRPCPHCLLFTGGVVDAVFQNCTLVERLWSVHRVRACGSYRCSIVPGLGEVVVKQIVTFKDNTISSVGIVGANNCVYCPKNNRVQVL